MSFRNLKVAFGSYLLVIGLCFAETVWAVVGVKVSGELPRDLSSFSLKVILEGVKQKAEPSDSGYSRRLEVIAEQISSSKPIPFPFTQEKSELNFEATASEDEQQETDGTYKVTIDIIVKETKAGELKKAVESSSDKKSLKVTVSYEEEGQDKKDGEVTLTRDLSIANAAPKSVTAKGSFRKIVATWRVENSISFSGSKTSGAPSGMTMYVIAQDLGEVDLPAKIFDDDPDAEVEGAECTVDLNKKEGKQCVTCLDSDGKDADIYLDVNGIKNAFSGREEDVQVIESSSNKGILTSSKLPLNKPYVVFLSYRPDSLQRSACFVAEAVTNTNLGEFYGEEEAKEGDPRCFIATAAYGTSDHHEVENFRWFRDRYLQSWHGGRLLVNAYYEYSPPVAELVRENPWLASIVRKFLYIPSKLVEFFRSKYH